MKKISSLFKDSANEFKSTRGLTLTAMLGALSVILGNFTIVITSSLKISFFFVPTRLVYNLFGPFVGIVFGASIDILNYIVKPTGPFHPGFTISAALSGMIFGLILYKKPLKLSRIILASGINMLVVNILLHTFWIYTIIGDAVIVSIPLRVIKNLVLWPFESILLYLVIKAIESTGVLKMLNQVHKK